MIRCDTPHPVSGNTCLIPEGVHLQHANGTEIWDDAEAIAAHARAPQRRDTGESPYRKGGTPKPTLTTLAELAAMGERVEPETHAGERSFNGMTKAEGMDAAAISHTSEEFRTIFFLAMAEAALTHEFLSSNEPWDLLESRGFSRKSHAQAVGTVGGSGRSIGLWADTGTKTPNLSGNPHGTQLDVNVYRSLIMGADFEAISFRVIAKAAALDLAKAKKAGR